MDGIIEPKYVGCIGFCTNKHSVDGNIFLGVYHTQTTGCPIQKLHLNVYVTIIFILLPAWLPTLWETHTRECDLYL
jgi:hypothetical protein